MSAANGSALREGARHVVIFNTESAYWYGVDPEFRAMVDASDMQTCDGAALQLAARLRGVTLPRYHGPDLMADVLASPDYRRIFVIGGQPAAHEAIARRFAPEGRVYEFDDSRIGSRLDEAGLERVRAFRPDAVFVCLGLGKQDYIAAQIARALGDQLCDVVGTGAAIDFLGGTKKRSPKFFQKIGMEWLPRLIREPRMLRRVLRSFAALPMVVTGRVGIIRKGRFLRGFADLERPGTVATAATRGTASGRAG